MADRAALGRWGEDVAVRHLEKAGYEVLARNWRCREGEIDIVARSGATICFVEVKTRSTLAFGEPAEAVRGPKARRQAILAAQWLRTARPRRWDGMRFDVISVLGRAGTIPEVTHLEGCL